MMIKHKVCIVLPLLFCLFVLGYIFGCGQIDNGGGSTNWVWEEHPELGTGSIKFSTVPLDSKYYDEFNPMGHMALPQHPIPTAAGGFQFNVLMATSEPQDIRAPARGVITEIRYSNDTSAGFAEEDYAVRIYHTNDFVTWLDHLSKIDNSVLSRIDGEIKLGLNKVYVTVEAGQVIAKTGKDIAGLGWYLSDRTKTLEVINPSKYGPYYPYSVFPLDYYDEPLRSQLYASVPRTKDPRSGKWDFDIDKTIQGNWIVEGSDVLKGEEPWGAWLSFAYDMYDPDYRRVSLGNVLARRYGFSQGELTRPKSGPEFTEVTPSSGAAVYKLTRVQEGDEFYGRTIPDEIHYTLLVQMVSDRKIKVELFSGEVSTTSFTSNAMYYTR